MNYLALLPSWHAGNVAIITWCASQYGIPVQLCSDKDFCGAWISAVLIGLNGSMAQPLSLSGVLSPHDDAQLWNLPSEGPKIFWQNLITTYYHCCNNYCNCLLLLFPIIFLCVEICLSLESSAFRQRGNFDFFFKGISINLFFKTSFYTPPFIHTFWWYIFHK